MTTINGVNFNDVVDDAVAAAKLVVSGSWDEIADIVQNIGQSLSNDVSFLARKKLLGEFNEDDARVFMEDQKMLARIRLRSIAIITLQIAEKIWNAMAEVFRSAINTALGWVVI
jgi:hypothetical protein